MRKSKQFWLVIAAFLFPPLLCAQTIRIGLLEYPPHVTVPENGSTGPALQYFELVFGSVYDVEFVYLPSKRGLRELTKGNIDLLSPYLEQKEKRPVLEQPILNVVPGLCFKKHNFIPFLSAPGAMDGLHVGTPTNLPLVPIFGRSSVKLEVIEGSDALERGIQLLLRDRIDGLYHPSPINVYHLDNPLSKQIACSLFYGFSKPVWVGRSSQLLDNKRDTIETLFEKAMTNQPYEYYLLDRS